MRRLTTLCTLLVLTGCPGAIFIVDDPQTDAGPTGADGSVRLDAGAAADLGPGPDGSVLRPDSGPQGSDGGPVPGAPMVTLSQPAQGAILEGQVAVAALVTAEAPLVRVELMLNGAVVTQLSEPYSYSWDTTQVADGAHTLRVEAEDQGGRIGSAQISVAVQNGFRETFANGTEDNPGWTRSAGFSVDTAEDHTGQPGSGSLLGRAATSELAPTTEQATLSVQIPESGKLSFFRKLELSSDGFAFTASYTVRVGSQVVDEASTLNVEMTDPDWVQVQDVDLSSLAGQTVDLTIEVEATSWTFQQEARAVVRIDDIQIVGEGAPPPPPPPPPGPPPPPPPPSGGGYDHASEQANDLATVLDITGRYGVAVAGGQLLAGDASGGTSLPRETPVSSSGSLTIPAGATVRHAILWYTGVIFMKPHSGGEGDYTSDLGGPLDDEADVRGNGITFSINGTNHGPYDNSTRQPQGASSLGHDTQVSPRDYSPSFGTLTGVKESVWANRLDITGLLQGASGTLSIDVQPPEKLDVNGNDSINNGGNPAGNTTYNLCTSGASWSLMVIYEQASLPEKNLVLVDGDWARAWDYIFFHSGVWQRPKIRIDHAPIQPGARLIFYSGSGSPAGHSIPTNPACSCGCGGEYTLRNTAGPFGRNNYFSDTHEDPPATVGDPIHRDRTNGPWYLHSTGGVGMSGNDWTLLQSGAVFTEFPNLFEGEEAPNPDSIQPVTNEDSPNAQNDTYGGHPWSGRGQVNYLAYGNALSVVEVIPEPDRITPGETTSYIYFKGDQKDVWKPQAIVSVKYILFETPVGP